jgi:hypothetical protein
MANYPSEKHARILIIQRTNHKWSPTIERILNWVISRLIAHLKNMLKHEEFKDMFKESNLCISTDVQRDANKAKTVR